MQLDILPYELTVCKLADLKELMLNKEFYFIGRTDNEISLVCKTLDVPLHTVAREDGWRGFRVAGQLEFSLVGILSELTGILAEKGIGIFAVSTYDTDYILVKTENFERAAEAFREAGHGMK